MRGEYQKDSASDISYPFDGTSTEIPDDAFRGASFCCPTGGLVLHSVTIAGEIAGFSFYLSGEKWATAITSIQNPSDMTVETLDGITAGVLLAGDNLSGWIQSLPGGTTPLRAPFDPSVIRIIPGITGIRTPAGRFSGHVAIVENGGFYMRDNTLVLEFTRLGNPRVFLHAIGHRDLVSVEWPLPRTALPSDDPDPIPEPFGFDILPSPFDPGASTADSVSIRFTAGAQSPVLLSPSSSGDISFIGADLDGNPSWILISRSNGGITIGLRGGKNP